VKFIIFPLLLFSLTAIFPNCYFPVFVISATEAFVAFFHIDDSLEEECTSVESAASAHLHTMKIVTSVAEVSVRNFDFNGYFHDLFPPIFLTV
jgi:hypothetical protein